MRIAALVFMACLAGCAAAPPKAPISITIADLRAAPEKYDGKLVRVRGIWFQDFETSVLISASLEEKDWIYVETTDAPCMKDPMYVEFEARRRDLARAQIAEFRVKHESRNWTVSAAVDLHGIFEVSRALKPARSSEGEELAVITGFGHLNTAPYQIRLVRLVSYEIGK